jgi:hypothetical protein
LARVGNLVARAKVTQYRSGRRVSVFGLRHRPSVLWRAGAAQISTEAAIYRPPLKNLNFDGALDDLIDGAKF